MDAAIRGKSGRESGANRSLRVALDGRNLQLSEGTGVATYGRCVVESLERLGVQAEIVADTARLERDTAATTPAARARRWLRALLPLPVRARAIDVHAIDGNPLRARFPWCARLHACDDVFGLAQVHFDLFGAPLRLRGDPPDLMHWTYPLPVRFEGARNLVTVHDLIPLRHPAYTSTDVARFQRLVTAVAAQADHIVTVSESARADIIALLGCPADKVTNTYEALGLSAEQLAAAHRRAASPDPALGMAPRGYLLYAGSIEPRKNVRGLIEAYVASGTTLPLVLVGPDGWRTEEQLRGHAVRIVDAPWREPGPAVVRLRYVPYDTLLALIAGARALVYPSFAEGFGLPILEAMTLGTPVVTSNIGAMAEIAGAAALLVDPHDPRDVARAIDVVTQDDARAAELAARGTVRAADFSIDEHAARLTKVYARLMLR
jgi:glycosyltransferase involved in cell wall biosynthesis